MSKKRDFSLKRNTRPITPEKLMSILSSIEGAERAKETYRNLIDDKVSETNRNKLNEVFHDIFGVDFSKNDDDAGSDIVISREWLDKEYKKPEV